MNNIEEMNDKQNNIIYIDKLNYEIQNFESNYIKEHYLINHFDDAKLNKILEKIKQFKKNNTLPDNIFWKELHKFSSKPGGFGTIKNRREIYSFILETLGRKPEYKLNSSKPTQEQINTYDTIIKNDCKRSVLYSLIKNNDKFKKYQSNKNDGEKDENQKVIEAYINELMDFTKESLGNYEYFNYFQGYQEVCLYFMVIFGRKEGVKYMTLFSKIYLDYVLSKKYKINFDMLLDILNECCNIVNKKVNTLINKITKTKPYYSLSWLITYLTHSNDNIYNQMSLLDYFITSNISHIYFLSANIIVSEFNKIGTKFNIHTADEEYTYMELFFQHFQKLKVSLIDYGIIIKKNEKINQNHFNEIISNMIKNSKNENDKGTLILLNKNIHDTSIFEYHSLKSQIINIITAFILLLIVKKLFF